MNHLSALQSHHFQYLSTSHQGLSESVTQTKLTLSKKYAALYIFWEQKEMKQEMSTIWGKECMWICQFTRNCSLTHTPPLTVQGSISRIKIQAHFSFVPEQYTLTHFSWKARQRIISECSRTNYQMATEPGMVYINHSNFSGKFLVTWAELVLMG